MAFDFNLRLRNGVATADSITWTTDDRLPGVLLVTASDGRFGRFRFNRNGTVEVQTVVSGSAYSSAGPDFKPFIETNGSWEVVLPGYADYLFPFAGADATEPYSWTPADQSFLSTFSDLFGTNISVPNGTLILRDYVPDRVLIKSTMGADAALIPRIGVVNLIPIPISVSMGTDTGLIPKLTVFPNVELSADIGTEPGLVSDLRVINLLSLSHWEHEDYSAPIVLASLRATVAAPDITVDPVVIADGELDVVVGLMITQVERFRNGGEIRLRRSQGAGTVNFNSAFGGNNIYAKAKLIIVLDDDDRTQIVFNQSNQGGGFSNWIINDGSQASLINDIATDDDFLLAIALPATELDVSIGSSIGLAPNLLVVNPIQMAADIGAKPGLASNLRVLNPLVVTMGAGAGVSPDLFYFIPGKHELNVSIGIEAGLVPSIFKQDILLGPVDGVGESAGLDALLRVGKNIDIAVSMGGSAGIFHKINVNNPTIIIGSKPMIAWAMEIAGIGDMHTPYRVWSGLGNLDWNGLIWDGTQSANGSFINVSPVTDKVGTPDRRASVSISVTAEMTRELLKVDVGPVSVFLRYLYSLDNGLSWIEAPMALAGRLSQPKFEQGLYTVEIETWSGDADRGEPKFWSDETQRAEYPSDKGFEFVRDLAQGIDTRWPP